MTKYLVLFFTVLTTVSILSLTGVYSNAEMKAPPLMILPTLLIIIALFRFSIDFRKKIFGIGNKYLTLFHLWRVIPGAIFLILYSKEMLPGSWALPAGVGDIIIALLAPIVAYLTAPNTRRGKAIYIGFHILGFVDLFGVVISGVTHLFMGYSQVAIITQFPMSILPSFLVPITLTAHIVSIYLATRSSK